MQSMRRVGRPERPVDPAAGPEQELAFTLRKLRADSGKPSYRAMAAAAHYSASALARAASGTALPSRDLVLAYVRACGGDQTEWKHRWDVAASQFGQAGERDSGTAPRPQRVRQRREGMLRRRSPWLTIAVVVAAVAAAVVPSPAIATSITCPPPRSYTATVTTP